MSAYLYHVGVTGAVTVSVDGVSVKCITAASLATQANPTLVTLHEGMTSGPHKVVIASATSCSASSKDDTAHSRQHTVVPVPVPSVLAAVGPIVGSRPQQ